MHWIIYLPTLTGEDIIMVSSGDAFVLIHFRLLLLQLSLWVLCLDWKLEFHIEFTSHVHIYEHVCLECRIRYIFLI